MSIKILIDRSEVNVGGWKVVLKRHGTWVTSFRGNIDECHDYARSLADDCRWSEGAQP